MNAVDKITLPAFQCQDQFVYSVNIVPIDWGFCCCCHVLSDLCSTHSSLTVLVSKRHIMYPSVNLTHPYHIVGTVFVLHCAAIGLFNFQVIARTSSALPSHITGYPFRTCKELPVYIACGYNHLGTPYYWVIHGSPIATLSLFPPTVKVHAINSVMCTRIQT